MTTGLPKQPTIRSIVLGIALLILLIFAFFKIPDIVKYAGTALMFVPHKLGLIEMVTPEEVIPVPIAENPSSITFPSAGQYALYTDNYNLLVVHDAVIAASAAEPWIKIQSEELDARVEPIMIERGLVWYDTPFARGRPVFTFHVDQPGTYQFAHPAHRDFMYLVPDRVTGKETLITFWVLVEVALIAGIIFYTRHRRTASAREKRVKTLSDNRARVEETWKRIEKQKEEKQRDEDRPYWKKR